jgi:O-antigen/teichoic acid export membrane protein
VIVAGLLPLGIAAALESWAVVWPRYSLEQALGLEQVGRFLIFSQIAIIFGIAASGRLQADMPKLARLSAENNRSAVLSTSLNAILSIAIINCILFIVMKSIPGSWIAFLFGEWVAKDSSLPAIVSVISWIWYSGGYVANCVAICKGRRWMALMACGLILVVLLVDLAGSRFVDNPYGVAVGALAIAFLARFIASLAVLLTWRYKC